AAIAAVIVAAHREAAVGLDLVIASAFLARGAIERVAIGAPLRAWDGRWCALLVAIGGIGLAIAMRAAPAIALATLGLGAIALIGATLARRARLQRSPYVEQAGLAALGASSGLAAWAGGAAHAIAIALGAVLAAHAASSVPIVRAAVR